MYSEKERPWFVWLFVVIFLACFVGYAIWGAQIFADGWNHRDGTPFAITASANFGIIVFMMWASWNYFVRNDGFALQFGYTGWNVRFEYSEIIEVKPVNIRWVTWGGFGWRLRPGGIGYIVRSGPGIELSTKRSRRTYTFNCRDREELLKSLGQAGVSIVSPTETAKEASSKVPNANPVDAKIE